MNVADILKNSQTSLIPNPAYNSHSKKNKQPKYLEQVDYTQHTNPFVALARQDAETSYRIDYDKIKKYEEAGLNWNPRENFDKILAERQSALSKFGNALAQTVVSEIGLGTALGIADLFDLVGQAAGVSDHDYQNPVSRFLEEKQEEFRNFAPIYADPEKNISNGGLLDAGWWASNMPSIASSLTLLIPSTGIVKGVSYAGKVAKLDRIASQAARTISRAEKTIKEGKELNAVQKFLTSSSGANQASLFLENGTTAVLSRAMENYQESRQTYNDMYAKASDTLANMSESEYQKWLKTNADFIEDQNIDSKDRDAVAKAISAKSADTTFKLDWGNVVWDVLQMYGLRNAWKGLKNAPDNPATVRRANLDAAKYFGKSKEEIAALKAKRSFKEKAKEFVEDRLYGSKVIVGAELSEGAEEALNYIAQQEGLHYGNVLIGEEQSSNFDTRLKDYLAAPELYDAAFWGVMGGVVFQGLGSQFRRLSNKLTDKESEANEESKSQLPWWKLDDLPENKRRKTEIEARGIDFAEYQKHLAKIREGVDIYHPNADGSERKFDSEVQQQRAEKNLKDELITKMTLRAMNSGNLDLFKSFMEDENVRKGMIEQGVFGQESATKSKAAIEAEAKAYVQDALKTIDEVENSYDQELVAMNSAASKLNATRRKYDENDGYDSYIPAEYLQLLAVKNVQNKLLVKRLQEERDATNDRISELETQFADKLDSSIDYEQGIRRAIVASELGKLYAEKKYLSQQEKTLSSDIALKNINKRIDSLERQLDDASLAYAVSRALRFTKTDDGKFVEGNTEEFNKYRFALTDEELRKTAGNVLQLEGLDYLSDRAKQQLSDEDFNDFLMAEQNESSALTLSNISPELNGLYQTRQANDIAQTLTQGDIIRTVAEVANSVEILHNTMNEARVNAINGAKSTLVRLIDIYKDKASISDIISVYNDKKTFDEYTKNLSTEDKQALEQALEVLDLTKDSNEGLYWTLQEELEFIENTLRTAQTQEAPVEEQSEEIDDDMEEGEPPTNITTTTSPSSTESTTTATTPQDVQNLEGRTPKFYTKFFYKKGQLLSSSKSTSDNGKTAVYENEDGSLTIDVRDNKSMLNDSNVFTNADEVDLLRPYEIVRKPIGHRTDNGKVIIDQPGELRNTDTVVETGEETPTTEPAGTSSTSLAPTSVTSTTSATTAPIAEPATTSTPETTTPETPVETTTTTPETTATTSEMSSTGEPTVTPVTTATTKETILPGIAEAASTSAPAPIPEAPKTIDDVLNEAPPEDVVRNDSLSRFIQAYKTDKNTNLDELYNNLVGEYVAKGVDRALAQKAATQAKRMIERRKLREAAGSTNTTMQSSVDEVLMAQADTLSSSTTEYAEDTAAVQAYTNAVDNMINQYAKEIGLEEVNGKKYINLEDLLRYTNNSTSDSTVASMLYSSMLGYLQTDVAKAKFRIMDEEEATSNNFLQNVAKTEEEREKERLLATDVIRADLTSYRQELEDDNDNAQDAYTETIESLQQGDKLTAKTEGNYVYVSTEDGKTVSRFSVPKVSSTGGYNVINNGWKSDVLRTPSGIQSSLKDLFKSWLTSNTEEIKELNSIIHEWAYDNPNDDRKIELLKAFEQNKEIIRAKNAGYTGSKATNRDLLNGLANLWKYAKRNNVSDRIQNLKIRESLDNWFEHLTNEYDGVRALAEGKVTPSVHSANDGEIIHAAQDDANAEIEALPAQQAIAGGVDPNIHKLGATLPRSNGYVTLSNSPSIYMGAAMGNTFVSIPNRSGRPALVHAYPAAVTDDYISDDAKEIINSVKEEAKRLLFQHRDQLTSDSYNELKKFFKTLLLNKDGNNSLFNGLVFRELPNSFDISIYGTNTHIQVFETSKNGGISSKMYVTDDEFEEQNNGRGQTTKTKTLSHGHKTTIDTVNKLIDNLKFNLSFAYLDSDSKQTKPMQGLATKTNGKFEITVGDKNWSYSSFNEFILKNNLVRLNTKPNSRGTSNFSRVAVRNQKANGGINLKLTPVSSPVEETSAVNTTTTTTPAIEPVTTPSAPISISDKVTSILNNNNTEEHKGLAIAALEFDENQLNLLKSLDILPKSIIFDETFNDKPGNEQINAQYNRTKGTITVGKKWLGMFNNPRTRQQAIRKLIHEQLHSKLTKHRGYLRSAKDIYNEFKEALDAQGVAKNDPIRRYLFENENEDVAIEEFLVESLTSKELADRLNSIEAKDYDQKKGRKNLFQKILELMSKVFNWGVKEGSLYEKELYTLRETIAKKETEAATETIENTEQATEESVEQPVTETPVEAPVDNTPAKVDVTPATEIVDDSFEEDISDEFMDDDLFQSSIDETTKKEVNLTPEMSSIKEQAIANGTFMKAPNGNPTNLNEKQWLQVRTKAFKNWFGDWEKAPSIRIMTLYQRLLKNGSNELKWRTYEEFRKDFEYAVQRNDYHARDLAITNNLINDLQEFDFKHLMANVYAINHGLPLNLTEGEQFDSDNISKVVDENGEPLVVYHGGRMPKIFDTSGKQSGGAGIQKGIKGSYFITTKEQARHYADIAEYKQGDALFELSQQLQFEVENGEITEEEANTIWNKNQIGVTSYFLNIRNPKINEYKYNVVDSEIDKDGHIFRKESREVEELSSVTPKDFDGQNIKIYHPEYKSFAYPLNGYKTYKQEDEIEWVATNPNQIKSATDNQGTFSTTNDSVYNSSIDEYVTETSNVSAFSSMLPMEQQAKFDALLAQGSIEMSCR